MKKILFRYLPLRISQGVHSLPSYIFENINEVRLRRNGPISVTVGTKNYCFDEKGSVCSSTQGMKASKEELLQCLSNLTQGSLYTCDEYIRQGFIPIHEGGRVGVCGKTFQSVKGEVSFTEITSINIRLHRFIPDFAHGLIKEFNKQGLKGTLVCSPPAIGKTTFLRSVAFLLSTGKGIEQKRVAIADERCEIWVGIENNGLLDILSGTPKAESITMLTRSMSPEVIICDEIAPKDTSSLLEAQNTGVHLIASAHCETPLDLMKRGGMRALIESGIFPLSVILSYDGEYKYKIIKTEDFL